MKQAEAGAKIAQLGRQVGITPQTFYRWKSKYGGMKVSDAKRLRELEAENRKLKLLLGEGAAGQGGSEGTLGKKTGKARATTPSGPLSGGAGNAE